MFLTAGDLVPIVINVQMKQAHRHSGPQLPHHIPVHIWSTCHLILTSLSLIHSLTLPSLPSDHFQYWLTNNRNELKALKTLCDLKNYEEIVFESSDPSETTDDLSVKQELCSRVRNRSEQKCWGYESDCKQSHMYSTPDCPKDTHGWARNSNEAIKVFFDSADFGYIRQRRNELKSFCTPNEDKNKSLVTSSLQCTQYMRFCALKNVLFDFEMLTKIKESVRYREDVIGNNHIGGWNCHIKQKEIRSEGHHKSPLQSWFAELENFKVFSDDHKCDVWIERPTFIMKLDATVNMYHHFCDFINLYASLHLNNSFSMDNNIIIWDSYPYRSNFGITWKAFTRNPVLHIGQFKGKRVCFRDLILPLLPRMIFGIYYNMPLIPGCRRSGLFHAFNRHLIHRLNIKAIVPEDQQLVRITMISRRTKYRQVVNENELLSALRDSIDGISVEVYDFNHWMPFADQINITANTDVLIGMHGAGLTHALFQPDWAVLFELYNCEDEHCYKDLARLRGIHYMTWSDTNKIFPQQSDHKSDNNQLSADAKFTNYKFDPKEFVRLVRKAVQYVRTQRKAFYDKRSDEKSNLFEIKTEL